MAEDAEATGFRGMDDKSGWLPRSSCCEKEVKEKVGKLGLALLVVGNEEGEEEGEEAGEEES